MKKKYKCSYSSPCKIGDTVYAFNDDFGVVLPYTITQIVIDANDDGDEKETWTFSANCSHEGELLDYIDFAKTQIGDWVFLTEEEAVEDEKRKQFANPPPSISNLF